MSNRTPLSMMMAARSRNMLTLTIRMNIVNPNLALMEGALDEVHQ